MTHNNNSRYDDGIYLLIPYEILYKISFDVYPTTFLQLHTYM